MREQCWGNSMTTLKKPSGTGFAAVSANAHQAESKPAVKTALWFESSAHRFKDIQEEEELGSNAFSDLSMIDLMQNPEGLAHPKPRK